MFHGSGRRSLRAFLYTLCGALWMLAGLALPAGAASYTVNLTGDSSCTSGATVAAVVFGNQGPDPSKTQLVTATGAGVATFTGGTALTTTDNYQFIAGNVGCSPTARNQANDPSNAPATISDGGSRTINMAKNSALATLQANLTLPAGGTFPKLVFGGCRNGTSGEDVDFSMGSLAGATGSVIFNLPPAAANTYNCGFFSPSDNRGAGTQVPSVTTAGATTIVSVDFTQFNTPPSGTQTQAQRNGNTQGGGGQPNLSVQVKKQSDGSAVSNAQLRLKTSTTTANPINIQFTDFNGVGGFFGLTNNTSYYLDVIAPGFQGATNLVEFAANWISSPVSVSTPLAQGTVGAITGSAKLNGTAVPQIWINCFPDFQSYPGSDAFGGNTPSPGAGFGNANASNGTFTAGNLSPGNYQCMINSPFSNQPTNINQGSDTSVSLPASAGSTQLRLTIGTTTVSGANVFEVHFASNGVLAQTPGTTLNVTIKPDTATANGTVTQKYVFPTTVDLSANPIAVIFHEAFSATPGTQPHSAFGVLNGSGQSSYTLAVRLPTGTKYFKEVRGTTYGPVASAGGNFESIDLTSQTTVTLPDQLMAKAGEVDVTLVNADGTRFIPSNNGPNPSTFCSAQINVHSDAAFQSNQVDSDGTGRVAGMAEGVCAVEASFFGGGCTNAPAKKQGVQVVAGQTTKITLNLQKGVNLEVNVTGTLPAGVNPNGPTGTLPNPQAKVLGFPRGTIFNLDLLRTFLGEGDSSAPYLAIYSDNSSFLGSKASKVYHGFSNPNQPDVVPPGDMTFLHEVFQFPKFDPSSVGQDPGTYGLAIGGVVSAPVSLALATSSSTIYGVSDVLVTLPMNYGNSTVKGTVKLTRFIQKSDFDKINGDFTKFQAFLPVCALYKSTTTGTGSGIPTAFAVAIPSQVSNAVLNIQNDVLSKNFAQFQADASSTTVPALSYKIPFVPAGTYTEVCSASAYPDIVQSVTVTAGTNTIANVNFDTQANISGTISGVVSDSSGKLSGALVTIKTKARTRTATTDSNGAYQIVGLPDGVYRISANYPGDAIGTNKATISAGSSATANFTLTASAGAITGTVVAATFPNRQVAAEAPVVAWDDTFRGTNPGLPPPTVFTQTDGAGAYSFTGFTVGDTIKICAYPDGKQVTCVKATAASSTVAASDILLTSLPPVPTVQVKPSSTAGAVDIHITVPKQLASNPSVLVNAGSTFSSTGAANQSGLVISVPATSGSAYNVPAVPLKTTTGPNVIRITGDDGNGTQSIDTVFDPTAQTAGASNSTIDRAAVTGGSVSNDPDSASAGSVDFLDSGSAVVSSDKNSVATTSMAQASTTTITTSTTTVIVGNPYTVTLSSAAQLATGTNITITLPLNGSTVDPKTVKFAQVVNGKIQSISCTPVVDSLAGTVSCDVLSVSNASGAPSLISGNQHSASLKGMAMFVNGSHFEFDAASALSQTGEFVILSAPVTGSAYTGSDLNAYNFPNPFNMQTKTLALANGGTTASITTRGTIIRYDLPAANAGHVIIRIYDLAGELVRVIDDGDKTGGATYYTTWDGQNFNGADVASGVYFGVFTVPGLRPKDHVVKMAVVK
jgi:hypothetical protein